MPAFVTCGDDLKAHRDHVIEALTTIHSQVTKNCLLLTLGETNFVTKMQAEGSIKWQNPTDQLIYNIIIDHCIRAEKEGPGSFSSTLSIILEALRIGTIEIGQDDFRAIVGASFVPTYDQLKSYVAKTVDDNLLSALVMETIEVSGLEGKIFFETSNNETLSVEQVNGFNFTVSFPFALKAKEKNVKVLIVDGFVESVSEIHHLLQKFSETNESLIFIARGFADDVINTLKVNYDRKTLAIIPVSIKFDFDGVNMLADIATVCCSDVISSAQGHLISSIKYEDIKEVPLVSCAGNTLTIVNDKAVSRAQIQVKKLLEKRREAPIEDLGRLYDVRIKSLTPCCTKVRIPSGRRYAEYSELFDVALRLVRSAIKRGLISKDRLGNQTLFCHFPDITTVESAIATLRYSKSCFRLLFEVSALIV